MGLPFRRGALPRLLRSLALTGAGLCLCTPAWAQAPQGVSPETAIGASYITGDYGTSQTTTVIYAPLAVTLRAPNWRLEATAPFIQIHGPNNVAGADGTPIVVGQSPSPETTRAGFGDLLLGGGIYLPRAPKLPLFDLSARVKIPTAAADLGTGRADYSAQLAAYEPVTPKLLLMASAGYQWLGNSDIYHLSDGPTGMVGFNYRASPAVDAGATLNFTSRIAQDLDHQIFVSPYLTWRVNRLFGVTGYALAGLTRSSPSSGGGIQLTFYR